MSSKTSNASEGPHAAELRRHAEERASANEPIPADIMTAAEARVLVHELQVHQIELEMQNEELQRARLEADEAREKYHNLFDFAPAGHFLWDADGRILEVNLAGAALLGLDRGAASQKQFGQFVAAEFRDAFADFLKRVLATDAKQTCEVKLQKKDSLAWVLVEGIAAEGPAGAPKHCRAAVIDFTQQKRADELATANRELQAAQRRAETYRDRYIDLYDQAPLGYVTLDQEGFIQEINLAGAAMLRREREELTGYEFAEYVVAADRTAFHEHVRQCCGDHREATTELGLVTSQGQSITVQIHSIPVGSDEHEGTFAKTAITDITERKRAEEAVRASAARHQAIVENTVDGIITIDERGIIETVNPATEQLFGYAAAEMIGANIKVFMPSPYHENHDTYLDNYRQTGNRKIIGIGREVVGRRKDGSHFPMQLSVSEFLIGGRRMFTGLVHDITERKRAEDAIRESENRYHSLFENMLDGFIYCQMLFDESGRPDDVLLLEVNRAFQKLTGLENVIGKRATEIIPQIKTSNPELFEIFGRVVLTGKAETIDVDFTPLGKWFSLSVYSLPERHFVVVFDDITQRIHLMESLEQHARTAEAANESKSQFLANVSHELRTPMTAILGMIDVALPKAADPLVQDCLQTAKGSADLLLTLLNDLLDSAKIESGKLELESAPFSLRGMLDQLTRALAIRASEKKLALNSRCSDELPDGFIGDRTRLQQVLFNLVGNAIKFTERGEVEISIRIVELQEGEGTATLEFVVRDTGMGIPPAEQQRLFQPFCQADASMARRFGGTGLGLAISKHLVGMMGGRIWVESTLGQGSTFHFTVCLPLSRELPVEDGPSIAILPSVRTPLRLLVVEDNPAIQKLIRYILQERGHRVEIAGEGQESVYLSQESAYDAILMDVQMPGMSGLEATAAIRRREAEGHRVPIIAMTAHAMPDDRERCLAAGMDGYLSKPVNARQIIALVEDLTFGRVPAAEIAGAARGAEDTPSPAAELVFDPELALACCSGSERMVQEIIQCFFADMDVLFAQMRVALANGALEEVGQLGHRMKSTVVYLGAQSAKKAAEVVEQYCTSGGGPVEAEAAINALEHECIALKVAIRGRLPL